MILARLGRICLSVLTALFGPGNLLANIIRLLFLVFAPAVGYIYISRILAAIAWDNAEALGGGLGLGIASTLLACEIAFRHRFTRTLVTFLIGLTLGMLISLLALEVMHRVIQTPLFRDNLDIPMAMVITYLVIMIVLHNADRFRVVVPFVEFRARRMDELRVVVDLSAFSDARLPAIVSTGLLGYRLATHTTVIRACQRLAESSDIREAVRGQRALEYINELRLSSDLQFELDASEIPRARTPDEHTIEMARLEGARLITADRNVVTIARSEEVRCVNLSEVSKVLAPTLHVGDLIQVFLQRPGEDPRQAVGFLGDGSMVVVEDGRPSLGREIGCTVLRMHHTSNGRMIFAQIDPQPTGRELPLA
jgi:uncharacterized protein YacL